MTTYCLRKMEITQMGQVVKLLITNISAKLTTTVCLEQLGNEQFFRPAVKRSNTRPFFQWSGNICYAGRRLYSSAWLPRDGSNNGIFMRHNHPDHHGLPGETKNSRLLEISGATSSPARLLPMIHCFCSIFSL